MKILAINFSQTGQLHEIMGNLLAAFDPQDVERVVVQPAKPYPFPWPVFDFFNEMPETVLEEGTELKPLQFKSEHYDLILLGYQPWFLSPSPVATAILKHPEFLKRLKNTPVITVSGCRNMWLNAQESIKKLILKGGGRLVGNIPFIDRNQNHISVLTIFHWLLKGRKDQMWGILPKPGVSDEDIASAARYGQLVADAAQKSTFEGLQSKILSLGLISVPTDILFIEERAKRLFLIWANLIKKNGTTPSKRKFWVNAFKYYLLTALFVVAPLLLTVYYVFFRAFTGKQLKRKKDYFCGIESKVE